MKKLFKILCSIIILVGGSVMLVACGSAPIVLSEPLTVGWTNAGDRNEETGDFENNKYMLVTDKNRYASGYEFFLTDSANYENYEEYVSLGIVETNYLDVTSKIDRQKEYHFYVRYIGTGRYANSINSKIAVIEPEIVKVDTPYLQINETELHWFRIQNANGYEIYETIVDSENNIIQNKTKIANLNSTTYSYNFSARLLDKKAPYYKYQYQIRALASGNYSNSDFSTINKNAEYVKQITLDKAKNINIDFDTKVLTFDKVEYCTNYEIKVFKTGYEKTVYSQTNSLNLLNAGVDFSSFETYKFTVKAKESDVIKYTAGDVSDDYEKALTTKFEAPSSIAALQTGDRVTINWLKSSVSTGSGDIEAQSYTVTVVIDGEQKSFLVSENNFLTLTFEDLFSQSILSENKEIEIKVKANAISEYIKESDDGIYHDSADETITKFVVVKNG